MMMKNIQKVIVEEGEIVFEKKKQKSIRMSRRSQMKKPIDEITDFSMFEKYFTESNKNSSITNQIVSNDLSLSQSTSIQSKSTKINLNKSKRGAIKLNQSLPNKNTNTNFLFDNKIQIKSIIPKSIERGTKCMFTIKGSGFGSFPKVFIGNIEIKEFEKRNDEIIIGYYPIFNKPTTYDLIIKNNFGGEYIDKNLIRII